MGAEQFYRAVHLLSRRPTKLDPSPGELMSLYFADARRAAVGTPRTRTEVFRRQRSNSIICHCRACRGVGLAGLAEPLRARHHSWQRRLHRQPSVVVLKPSVDDTFIDVKHSGSTQKASAQDLGDLRADLSGIGID
jgi:hypothetical protein